RYRQLHQLNIHVELVVTIRRILGKGNRHGSQNDHCKRKSEHLTSPGFSESGGIVVGATRVPKMPEASLVSLCLCGDGRCVASYGTRSSSRPRDHRFPCIAHAEGRSKEDGCARETRGLLP